MNTDAAAAALGRLPGEPSFRAAPRSVSRRSALGPEIEAIPEADAVLAGLLATQAS